MVDYYRVLEVNKASTTADIKKAYKRLALKWHPDKNPDNPDEANKRFKEISEAYEVLSDEKKRRVYDQYGREGLNERRGRTGGRHYQDDDMDYFGFQFTFRDPEEVFKEFFGGSSFADLFGGGRRQRFGGHPDALTSMFSPMGLGIGLEDMLSNGVTFTSFSSTFGNNISPQSKRTSTSTRFINGKKITTKKVVENGKETVMQYENDVLKLKTVNGVSQAISYN